MADIDMFCDFAEFAASLQLWLGSPEFSQEARQKSHVAWTVHVRGVDRGE